MVGRWRHRSSRLRNLDDLVVKMREGSRQLVISGHVTSSLTQQANLVYRYFTLWQFSPGLGPWYWCHCHTHPTQWLPVTTELVQYVQDSDHQVHRHHFSVCPFSPVLSVCILVWPLAMLCGVMWLHIALCSQVPPASCRLQYGKEQGEPGT